MRKDFNMRKLLVAGMAALLSLAIVAAPASAKRHSAEEFDYVATIDCGFGPWVVGSGVDTASPFVELNTGVELHPVEWSLQIGDATYEERIPNRYRGIRLTCSYDDGFATGKVRVVVKLDQFRGFRGLRHD
jgi:hypothetical protein